VRPRECEDSLRLPQQVREIESEEHEHRTHSPIPIPIPITAFLIPLKIIPLSTYCVQSIKVHIPL
jgi:hypothetical protein